MRCGNCGKAMSRPSQFYHWQQIVKVWYCTKACFNEGRIYEAQQRHAAARPGPKVDTKTAQQQEAARKRRVAEFRQQQAAEAAEAATAATEAEDTWHER